MEADVEADDHSTEAVDGQGQPWPAENEARDLMALCLRVLLAVTCGVAVLACITIVAGAPLHWLWLPAAVAVAGALQWLTLWATCVGYPGTAATT